MRVSGALVRLARDLRRKSQTELAEATAISKPTLCRIERDERVAQQDEIRSIASALCMPEHFFSTSCLHSGSIGEVHFRRKASTLAMERRWAVALINIATHISHQISNQLSLPSPTLTLEAVHLQDFDDSPERVAQWLRSHWHLPPGPIRNLVEILETAGVFIFTADLGYDLFGLSLWPPDREPVILVNSSVEGDRFRWTIAHELGHLIQHADTCRAAPSQSVEIEANRFAAELLTPIDDLRSELRGISLDKLGALKMEWGVSMQSLLMRAKEMGSASPYQVEQMFKLFGKKGWRKKEPYRIPVERTNFVPLLCNAFVEQLGSITAAAKALCISEDVFVHLTPRRRAPRAHGHLKLLINDDQSSLP